MLLGFGRGKKEKDYTELRRTQVDGFKRAFPTAKPVTSVRFILLFFMVMRDVLCSAVLIVVYTWVKWQDDSAFDIAIPSASATAFVRVILPPNFPEAPPGTHTKKTA